MALTARFLRANKWLDRHPALLVTAAVVVFVLLCGAVVGNGVANYHQNTKINSLAHENRARIMTLNQLVAAGKDAHDALCVFRDDLEIRVDASRAFLFQHPEGFAGIDATTILESINQQQHTVDALASLNCKGG